MLEAELKTGAYLKFEQIRRYNREGLHCSGGTQKDDCGPAGMTMGKNAKWRCARGRKPAPPIPAATERLQRSGNIEQKTGAGEAGLCFLEFRDVEWIDVVVAGFKAGTGERERGGENDGIPES